MALSFDCVQEKTAREKNRTVNNILIGVVFGVVTYHEFNTYTPKKQIEDYIFIYLEYQFDNMLEPKGSLF